MTVPELLDRENPLGPKGEPAMPLPDGKPVRDDHALVGVATGHAISRAGRALYNSDRTPWQPVEVYLLGYSG